MPIYVYRCEVGHEFEELQGLKEEALTRCNISIGPPGELMHEHSRACGAPVERVISKVSFSFKGGAPTPRHYDRG
jgi:predicted nucleic acid-binding Zn ribbon protein